MATADSEDAIDRTLLVAVAGLDRAAFERLYHRYARRVHGYVKGIVRDPGTTEDVVVATMTTVWQIAASFAARSRVSTWILGIARHKALDAVRSRLSAPLTLSLELAGEFAETAAAAIDVVDSEQLGQAMQRAMSRLSVEHREALRLAYYEELPYEDIATLLGIPTNTVKSRVFYAKQELSHLLSGPGARSLPLSTHFATGCARISTSTRAHYGASNAVSWRTSVN
jgi:RNA polymerase sigma-70 factor, ECF subfamily